MIDEHDYWNKFYEENGVIHQPSSFARYIEDRYFENGKTLLELGCGNGRDAIFFAEKGKRVSALDLSSQAIQSLSSMDIRMLSFLTKIFLNSQTLKTLIMFILDSHYIRLMKKQNK